MNLFESTWAMTEQRQHKHKQQAKQQGTSFTGHLELVYCAADHFQLSPFGHCVHCASPQVAAEAGTQEIYKVTLAVVPKTELASPAPTSSRAGAPQTLTAARCLLLDKMGNCPSSDIPRKPCVPSFASDSPESQDDQRKIVAGCK